MKERLYIWLADHLPSDLVKWCAVRVGASASLELEFIDMPDIGILDAVSLWEKNTNSSGFYYLRNMEEERIKRLNEEDANELGLV